MANPVCYDDIVYIDVDDSVLFSNGFFDPTLHFVSKPNIGLKSFKNGLFKLYPNLSYKDISQVDQLKDQLDLLKSLNPQEEVAFKELNKDLDDEQKALEERDTKLELLNDKILAEFKGHPIRYGQKIQLYHIESESFVRPGKPVDDDDMSSTYFELTKQGNKNIYFKFVPMVGFIQEGDIVEYNIPLKVVSIKLDQPIMKSVEVDFDDSQIKLNDASNMILNNADNFPPVQPRRQEPLFQQDRVFRISSKPSEEAKNGYIRKFIPSIDQDELNKKRTLVNGDYIRISNDKVYLTVFQGRNEDTICFQNYSDSRLKYSSLYTLFQVIETQEDSALLPRGNLLKYTEGKKYILRHVASGKVLGADEFGNLRLYDKDNVQAGVETVSLVLKNKSKDTSKTTYIDKNSIMIINFFSANGKEEGTLTIGAPQKLPSGNLDTNTAWFYGFGLTDNYLNKTLRTERFNPEIKKNYTDDRASYLKFTKLTSDEIAATFLVESIANRFASFLDYLDKFIRGENQSIREFNKKVSKLVRCCQGFEKEMYETPYTNQNKDTLVPDAQIQTLVREFRIYDMIYRIFFHIARDDALLQKAKLVKDARPSTPNSSNDKKRGRPGRFEDHKAVQGFDFAKILNLFTICKKILSVSYKKNPTNRYYCSQFIRVPINAIFGADQGLFSLADYSERLGMKEVMLEISKKGLWDEDLDALGQLNYYQDDLFTMAETQESFHTVYLRLLEHVSLSKAPNLTNHLRNNFVHDFLRRDGALEHIFPRIFIERDKIFLEFKRKIHPQNNFQIALEELDERTLSEPIKGNASDDRIRQATSYLIAALDLLGSIALVHSPNFTLEVVKYYRYDTIIKAINSVKTSANHTGIRQNFSEIMTRVHQNFFSLPFTKVPNRLQILNEDATMQKTVKDINSFIKNAVNTNLSTVETNHIKKKDVLNITDQLKTALTSDADIAEVISLLRNNLTIAHRKECQSTLEEVKKIFETNVDISFEFLQESHRVILRLIREAYDAHDPSLYEFIEEALEVFSLVEENKIQYVAIDVINTLKYQNKLKGSFNRSDSDDSHMSSKERRGSATVSPLGANSKETLLKPSQAKILPSNLSHKELSTKYGLDGTVAPSAIESASRGWKSGEKLMNASKFEFNKIVEIENSYKEAGSGTIVDTFLDIALIGQDILLTQVIHQLKRISSFESLLYSELNRVTIIHSAPVLRQTADLIEVTFRLNEISREITFRDEHKIDVDYATMNRILEEILELVWKTFFAIYDPVRHFKNPDPSKDQEKRFKLAFLEGMKDPYSILFKLNPQAINRPFQKIFSILSTHKALLKTLDWVAEKKKADTDLQHIYACRLIVLTLNAFLNQNRENQDVCSKSNEFIKLFYNQHILSQSADLLLTFAEMMRNNKRLLKLPFKYLYDITSSTVIGTLYRTINDYENNSYLAAAIEGYDVLFKCGIPRDFFDPLTDLKSKWNAIATGEFPSLNVASSTESPAKLPFSYYSIRETMESTFKLIPDFASKGEMSELQNFLSFNEWLHLLSNENFLMQYELRNFITKCISEFYFKNGKKATFSQTLEETSAVFSCLVHDLLAFRTYVTLKEKQSSAKLQELKDTPSFITGTETYENLSAIQTKNKDLDYSQKQLRIFFEDFTLESLFFEYINEGCLDLLFSLILNEVSHCTETVGRKNEFKTMMNFLLQLLDEFITFEGDQERFPYRKIEEFLSRVSVTKGYEKYKAEVVTLTNKLYATKPAKGRHLEKMATKLGSNETAIEITPLDSFNHHLRELQKQKNKLKEQNIQALADDISRHKNSSGIISALMNYLKKNHSKLQSPDLSFLLKLLRKYIEREHANNINDDPIYKWKDVNIGDLKKIERIQSLYRDLGLTEILYDFLNPEDPNVYRESLLLSLAYMYGGNRSIQEEYFQNFIDDDENSVLSSIGKNLDNSWARFREKEGERIYHTYIQVQKNLFEHYKGRKTIENISHDELPLRALERGVPSKYRAYVDANSENQLFMLTLTFLQAICEGQYTDMQLFLKEQIHNGHVYPQPYDFIGFLRHSINSYHKVLNKYNLSIGLKILELINELIQGEVCDNIYYFLNKTFIYDMCRILTDYNSRYHTLPRGFGLDPFDEEFRLLKSRVIFVFKIMLENRDQRNLELLSKHLDTKGLMETFTHLMDHFLTKNNLRNQVTHASNFILSLKNEDLKDTLGDAMNIYIIFRYLWEDTIEFNDKMRDLISEMEKKHHDMLGRVIFTLCKKLVNSIELVAEDKAEPLMRVWFPVLTVCNYLSADVKMNFANNVDRSNSQTKISGLMDASDEFIPLMNTDYKARHRLFGFNMKNSYDLIRALTNLIGLAVTILNIATYKLDSNDDEVQSDSSSTAQKAMNIAQIVFAGLLVFLWLLFYSARHQTLTWDRFVSNNVKNTGFLPPTIKNKLDEGNYDELDESDCRMIMLLKGPNSDDFADIKTNAPQAYALISSEFRFLNTFFLFNSFSFIWHIAYVGICIGSLFHPVVCVFQIFDIAIRSDTIKQIAASISKNASQFIWTLFLLLVVNVVYSTIGFFFMNDQFQADGDPLCPNAFSCFMNTLNLGLRSGGGIADAIGTINYSTTTHNGGKFFGRAIFDLSFFIIMIILLLNLIFGMIIDAFGDLRDQKTSNEEDAKNVCFICGIERSEFERHINFENHVLDEHNLWSYIYYLVYLIDRAEHAKVEMTDIENMVLKKYHQNDFGWIPVGQSLTLTEIYEEEKLNKENELDKVAKKVDAVQKGMGELETRLVAKIEYLLTSKK